MKLNLGSGGRLPGYINVDIRKEVNPDVVWDLEQTPYPWEDCSVDEILMVDTLEHLSFRKVRDVVKELYRILKPGGKIFIQVPDMEARARDILEKWMEDWWSLSFWVYGGQEYKENTHKSGFTVPSLKKLLEEEGFKVEKIVGGGNIQCWAVKPQK
jgi:predicted SAM-dependent methyltransferase